MADLLSGIKRTNYCGTVDETLSGKEVTVMGFVNKRRDLGKLIFLTIRDRTGVVQAVIDGESAPAELFAKAERLRSEFVVAVTGIVNPRAERDINPKMKTGKIEITLAALKIFSEAQTPPFSVADTGVANDLRLEYRYLDLRRPELFNSLYIRHQAAQSIRSFLTEQGFIEVETPMLTKSTPEGARDYLVPSRLNKGCFYALPQSPQIFKQLLMVAGFDKYYQITRCFRDEDLRADRQPEFTQVDMELSFVEQDDVITVNEELMRRLFKDVLGQDVQTPIKRLTYQDAMDRFGSDKPDDRFGLMLVDISAIVKDSGFAIFDSAIESGGSVRAINAIGQGAMPRKQIDSLVELAKYYKAKGLAWITVTDDGFKTTLSKFFTNDKLGEIAKAMSANPGDLLLICADANAVVYQALGEIRLELGRRLNLIPRERYSFLWVTEFPLLEFSPEDNRYYAKHHPFTAPMDEDLPLLDSDPASVRAKAYDLVLNGCEVGGGSIRIHDREVQEKLFQLLSFTKDEAYERFGFMLNAFKYGVPPHGGLAYGLDRLAMLLSGADSIRDVIAFPKVKDGSCPMTSAPTAVEDGQLLELGLRVKEVESGKWKVES